MALYLASIQAPSKRRKQPIFRFVLEHNERLIDVLSRVSTSLLPQDSMPIFDGWTDNEGNPAGYYTNPQFWYPEIRNQLMAMPAWASNNYHQQGGGTLITPRHCLFTNHGRTVYDWGLKAGMRLRWADINTQQTFEATILAVSGEAGTGPIPYNGPVAAPSIGWDANILVLDSDVPSWVTPASFLAISEAEMLTFVNSNLLCVKLSQGRVGTEHASYASDPYARTPKNIKLYISPTSIFHALRDNPRTVESVAGRVSAYTPYRANQYYHSVVSGDSGMPMFVVVDDKLCVLNINTSGFLFYQRNIDEVNAAIAALDSFVGYNTGYQIDVVPLPYR